MPDASGTPTSPDNIPTFNTAVDPPSGKGFNTAMAQIQTIITELKAGTLPSGKIDVAGISASGTPSASTFLRGDGAWASATVGVELTYAELTTATTNITATTSGTATTLITAAPFTADGAFAVVIEAYVPDVDTPAAVGQNLYLGIFEDGTLLSFARFASDSTTIIRVPGGSMKIRRIPASGSRTYSLRSWVDSGTGVIRAGTAAGGSETPAFIRVVRVA